MAEYGKLLDDLNLSLQAYAQEAFTFPVAEELPPIGNPTKVVYSLDKVPPPGAFYLGIESLGQIAVLSSVASVSVRVNFTMLSPDGRVSIHQFVLQAPTIGTTATLDFRLGEGFLLSIFAQATTAGLTLGQCYVRVVMASVLSGATQRTRVLIGGYVTTTSVLSWPENEPRNSMELEPFPSVTDITDPATGAAMLTGSQNGQMWEVKAVVFTFSTSVVAANRRVRVRAQTPSTQVIILGIASANQTALQTRQYTGGTGLGLVASPTESATFPILDGMPLPPGTSIIIDAEAMDVDDAFFSGHIWTRERLDF